MNGQQLFNTLTQPGEPLPRRNPLAIEAQQRALATGSIVISDVLRSPVAQDWVANIEVPIFKNGQPFRGLAVGIRGREFLPLLSVRDIPKNWLVGIIDGQGRFIARVPQGATEVGQLASQGWRAIKDRTGVFEYPSLEGDTLITANALPSISNWTVGVAVKKAELRALAWNTVRWAAMLGAGLSVASLLLAGAWPDKSLGQSTSCARRLPTCPRNLASRLRAGRPRSWSCRTRSTARWSSGQTRTRHSWRPSPILSARWRCVRRHRQRWRNRSVWKPSASLLAAWRTTSTMCWRPSPPTWIWSRFAALMRRIREAVQDAMDAIQMGASLTRRLLILSSQHGVGLERLDLNDRVTGTIELLRRTLGEQVTVSLRLSPDPCQTLANPGDVDNAILNLAINARDAMPSGGMLTIETRHVTLDADAAAASRMPGLAST